MANEKLSINYNEAADVVEIDGIKYSGEVFRYLSSTALGRWFRIENRKDGLITVFSVSPETNAKFNEIADKA